MKICVGLSGGVDSSVAALLLKQQGFDVFAMFMQNWHDTEGTLHGDCEWEEDKFVAEMVARKLGIPFYFVDLSDEYRKRVVDYMFSEYEAGRTPNPDVLCNREIKFDAFLKKAREMGADKVATGHYCRKEQMTDESGRPVSGADGRPVWRLLEGIDPGKDQSYFLCQLNQEQLDAALFPIGGLLKSQVRDLAKEADLPSAGKKDSQGICFVGKVDLPVFLQQKLKPAEGEIIEVLPAWYEESEDFRHREGLIRKWKESGSVEALSDEELDFLSRPFDYSDIRFETETYRSGKKHIRKTRLKPNRFGAVAGRHDGAQFYTLGQRKGLAVGGHEQPLFVIATDMQSNRVYVGEGESHPGLYGSCIRLDPEKAMWTCGNAADGADSPESELRIGQSRRYRVRIRYRQPLQDATLIRRRNGLFILFDEPQRSITPGQFAAWYGLQDPSDPWDAPALFGSAVI